MPTAEMNEDTSEWIRWILDESVLSFDAKQAIRDLQSQLSQYKEVNRQLVEALEGVAERELPTNSYAGKLICYTTNYNPAIKQRKDKALSAAAELSKEE